MNFHQQILVNLYLDMQENDEMKQKDIPAFIKNNFKTIYKEEVDTFKNQITDSQAISSPEEFFAEIFSYIYKDNIKCTPKALEFVENKIDEL